MKLSILRLHSSVNAYSSLLSAHNKETCIKKLKGIKPLRPAGQVEPLKTAAILVPLVHLQEEPALIFTKRSKYLTSHRGQVSFPGGNSDKNDKGPEETALRECEEEIGIPPESVEIWARMSPLASSQKGDYVATPVVGYVHNFDQSKLVVSEEEVDEVFTVKLSQLCHPDNCKYTQFRFDTLRGYSMPMFDVLPFPIWGLTAIITFQVLKCLVPGKLYRHKILYQTPLDKIR
eukprot:TRINITY_DN12774_c0_g1_i1.p1 TRINITY_DN12774_c0_g1~~TRINITY_DN12774_c0_g1_i1.p1  ORF type:complete len:232 (-),score=27.25 TRINITY_DN12774_c0_g1_i1:122-817(-)